MKSISEQLPVHTITIAKKQWSPLIFNMATILTKEVKDVHLEHSSGHTPARLKAFSQLFVKKSLAGKEPICGAPEYQSGWIWKLADWYPSLVSSPNSHGYSLFFFLDWFW